MKKFFCCMFFALCLKTGWTQNPYEELADKFLVFYNAETPDSLFFLYTDELKEKLPVEKNRSVLTGLHVQFGELRSLTLLKQDSGFYIYKASFSHQTLSLLLSVTDNRQIEGFRLVPYDRDLFDDKKKNAAPPAK